MLSSSKARKGLLEEAIEVQLISKGHFRVYQMYQKTNKMSVRISAPASKNRLNQKKIKTLFTTNEGLFKIIKYSLFDLFLEARAEILTIFFFVDLKPSKYPFEIN